MANVRVLIAVILAVLVIHLILLGLFANGWVTGKREDGIKYNNGIGLREWEWVSHYDSSITVARSRIIEDREYESAKYYKAAGLVAYTTLWVSLIAYIGAVVFTILGRFGKMSGRLGLILGFATGGLMLLAAILWLVIKPELETHMHLGWTFYAVIVGGMFQIVGSALMLKAKKGHFIKKWNMKELVTMGMALVVVHIIWLGLFTNSWVTGVGDDDIVGKTEIGIGLRGREEEWFDHSSVIEELSYMAKDEDYKYLKDYDQAGLIAYVILWVSMGVCIVATVFTILGRLGKMGGKIGMILGFVGGGSILLSVILWVIMIPKLESTMGFGWTFYMVIVGGIIQTVSTGLMMECKQEESKIIDQYK